MKNRVIECLVLLCLLVFSLSCGNLKKQHEVTFIEFLSAPGAEKLALPFSEAVRVGDMLYLSGQVGTVPGTTELVHGGISEETRQVLENIKAILERNGSTLNCVVKCTVFLADINEWPKMNEIYRTYFPKAPPARSAMAASGLALNARVEIECIAVIDQEQH
ncbi:RidA family protein [Planctomycetota bacterium]